MPTSSKPPYEIAKAMQKIFLAKTGETGGDLVK